MSRSVATADLVVLDIEVLQNIACSVVEGCVYRELLVQRFLDQSFIKKTLSGGCVLASQYMVG